MIADITEFLIVPYLFRTTNWVNWVLILGKVGNKRCFFFNLSIYTFLTRFGDIDFCND